MRGTTLKRGKSWTYVVDLGERPCQRCDACGRDGVFWIEGARLEACPRCGGELHESRQRRREWKSGFATKREAQAAMDKQKTALAEGTYLERSAMTLGDWIESWITE